MLPVQLTEEELKIKGEELAKTTEAHRDLETEKKRIARDYTQRMKDSSSEIFTPNSGRLGRLLSSNLRFDK